MKHKINEIIYQIARYIEIIFSAIIIVVIGIMVIPVLRNMFSVPFMELDTDHFREFLSSALILIVGVEFVKMLCKHTAETLLEVMLFAIARQMVVEHLTTTQTLIGVAAIAILFGVRKYLLLDSAQSDRKTDKL